jgi:small neutral amino acid transporter SnatA (MarC family)
MDRMVAAVLTQMAGLAIAALSVAMLLLGGGQAWYYVLALGVLLAIAAFFYLGSRGRASADVKRTRRRAVRSLPFAEPRIVSPR